MLSLRQVEQDVETVIHVLQPGPVGIVEHKFTDAEILEARAIVLVVWAGLTYKHG